MNGDEWFEVEVAYRFKPDEWNKTYHFDRGAKNGFATLDEAQEHVRAVQAAEHNVIYHDASFRYVRYTREVLA